MTTHSNGALIDLRSVFKSYPTGAGEVPVLRGIDLQVQSGEFIGLVGPSGSGKSTLINMITGIDRPTSGDVWIAGQRINDLSENRLASFRGRHIGIIFQFFQLLPTLTVVENVMLPMDFCRVGKRNERRDRALALLELVGVPEIADQLPSQTSGGQQQRAAMARALANDPQLILADEPTGNLDTMSAGLVFALFEELVERGKTLIMVTHDKELAALVPRIEELRDGHLVTARSAQRPVAPATTPQPERSLTADGRWPQTGRRWPATAAAR